MADTVADRVRTIIAEVLCVPPANIGPETLLSIGDLGFKGFLMIALEIEHRFDVDMPVEIHDAWTSVADVVIATETAIAADLARRNAA